MAKVVIIVLSYNSLDETTKPCLESIYTCKTKIDFETVVVDNLSTDGTHDYLASIRDNYNNLCLIFNDHNYGYAKGNNIGIRSTQADYYVLLNSDTIVTDYWLDKFVEFLEHHPQVGMAGPVSNSVGCGQRIFCNGVTQDEILAEGEKWSKLCEGDFFLTDMLGFFCVCIRKEVFEIIGLLDEQFGIGMFEDDDFCLRAQQKDYKMACLEDVFIYHKGSVSFKKLDQDYHKLFSENASKFEKKHQRQWHTYYRTSSITSLINNYLKENSDNPDKLRKKIANKLQVIDGIQKEEIKEKANYIFILNEQINQIYSSNLWKIGMKLKRFAHKTRTIYLLKSLLVLKRYGIGELCKRVVKKATKLLKKVPLAIKFFKYLSKNGFSKTLKRSLVYLKDLIKKQINILDLEKKLSTITTVINDEKNNYEFIDILHIPMGWNTPLFQRFQHISLQVGKIGGLAFYGGHTYIDKDCPIIKKINDHLYIVNMEYSKVQQKFLKIIDKYEGKKIIRIQSIDMKTTIEDINNFITNGYTIVYEYIDEITPEITGTIPQFVLNRHKYLLEHNEVFVIATSDQLFEHVKQYRNHKSAMICNGVDYEHWHLNENNIEVPDDIIDIIDKDKLIIGYHGALAQWIDYEALKTIADCGKYILLLIGYEHDDSFDISGLKNHENVRFIGHKSYNELNKYCMFYDIALIPFKINEITKSVSPVKLFEYMAANKPIVTSAMPECLKYKSCLVAHSTEEYLINLEKASVLRKDIDFIKLLDKEGLENTWKAKALEMKELVLSNQ